MTLVGPAIFGLLEGTSTKLIPSVPLSSKISSSNLTTLLPTRTQLSDCQMAILVLSTYSYSNAQITMLIPLLPSLLLTGPCFTLLATASTSVKFLAIPPSLPLPMTLYLPKFLLKYFTILHLIAITLRFLLPFANYPPLKGHSFHSPILPPPRSRPPSGHGGILWGNPRLLSPLIRIISTSCLENWDGPKVDLSPCPVRPGLGCSNIFQTYLAMGSTLYAIIIFWSPYLFSQTC